MNYLVNLLNKTLTPRQSLSVKKMSMGGGVANRLKPLSNQGIIVLNT